MRKTIYMIIICLCFNKLPSYAENNNEKKKEFSKLVNAMYGNNLEGVGGIALFNPSAYFKEYEEKPNRPLSIWFGSLNEAKFEWNTFGFNVNTPTMEILSMSFERIAKKTVDNTYNLIWKSNYGFKISLLKENFRGLQYIPAISIGTIYKDTDTDMNLNEARDNSFDFYLVGTKTFTLLPKPLIISAGLLSTRGQATGIYGFNSNRDETIFANVDLFVSKDFMIGFEYKEGASFSNLKNENYWDVHINHAFKNNFTFCFAYVDAGDETSTTKMGLGKGIFANAYILF